MLHKSHFHIRMAVPTMCSGAWQAETHRENLVPDCACAWLPRLSMTLSVRRCNLQQISSVAAQKSFISLPHSLWRSWWPEQGSLYNQLEMASLCLHLRWGLPIHHHDVDLERSHSYF